MGKTWNELKQHAEAQGWQVRDVEHYNPGGTTYTTELFDPDGVSHGRVTKTIQSKTLGKFVMATVPDPEADAWKDVPNE